MHSKLFFSFFSISLFFTTNGWSGDSYGCHSMHADYALTELACSSNPLGGGYSKYDCIHGSYACLYRDRNGSTYYNVEQKLSMDGCLDFANGARCQRWEDNNLHIDRFNDTSFQCLTCDGNGNGQPITVVRNSDGTATAKYDDTASGD